MRGHIPCFCCSTNNQQLERRAWDSCVCIYVCVRVCRFEMPYHIWCGGCEAMIAKGVRFNAEKKQVGNYFSTKVGAPQHLYCIFYLRRFKLLCIPQRPTAAPISELAGQSTCCLSLSPTRACYMRPLLLPGSKIIPRHLCVVAVLQIWSFKMKAACCQHEIEIQTDPKACAYVVVGNQQPTPMTRIPPSGCMHTCIHAYMHTCIHAYMHTCTHAHIHACTHAVC